MIVSKRRDTIVDYLGTRQHIAVDLHCRVDDDGAMCIRSGEQRFNEGPVALRSPLSFSGVANVREWWDEAAACFRIEVHVANTLLGPLFGCRGPSPSGSILARRTSPPPTCCPCAKSIASSWSK